MWPVFAMLAFFAAQLNPSLTPRKAAKPVLPKVDYNACPFEGCQFGKWVARQRIDIYDTWTSKRRRIGTLQKSEEVNALTGVHMTYEPAVIRVTAPMPDYGLKTGDTIFGYMNLGEGVFNAWFNGYWVEEFDGSGIQARDGSGCRRNCNAELLKPARSEWWVKIQTKDSLIGWTNRGDQFDGSDALAGR